MPTVSTFHSFGLRILKENANKLNFYHNLAICDAELKQNIFQRVMLAKKGVGAVAGQISLYKQGCTHELEPEVLEFYKKYTEELRRLGAVDLDDLIYLTVKLFNKYPQICAKYQKQYHWIFIDECQDLNPRQYEMAGLLAGSGKPNFVMIGDPDQAIYGFRGADARVLEKFLTDYPEARVIDLDRSYRCPQKVLNVAGQVLEKKEYLKGKEEDILVEVHECLTQDSEADYIAQQIEKMIGGVRSFSIDSGVTGGQEESGISSFSDFAILCRTSQQFQPLIKALENHGVSYQIVGTDPFYAKPPAIRIVQILKELYFQSEVLLLDVGISNDSFFLLRSMVDLDVPLTEVLESVFKDIKLPDLIKKQFIDLAKGYGNKGLSFLQDLALRKGVDDWDKRSEAVSVMTLHAAKGLEFKSVFIPGCEHNLLPFELFGKKTGPELAEEARLFYVGVTRTKKYLTLTYAKNRTWKGRALKQERSPFLARLDVGLLELGKRVLDPKHSQKQLALF
ncbi:ATP-dependent helicase [Candidatus Margulisiibacteriota bacterium]